MGLFKKKEPALELSIPASIVLTCNSIPVHDKATYWFEVLLNYNMVGRIEQNGVSLTLSTTVNKNVLGLVMFMKESIGKITEIGGRNLKLDLKDGEKANVVFEKRRFIVNGIIK